MDKELKDRHADLLYSVKIKGRRTLLYVLLEHQSTVVWLMLFRVLAYMVRIWEEHLKTHPKARTLPPIVPLVLYQGPRGWTAARQLSDLIDGDAALLSALNGYLPRFEVCLVDLAP